jgi:hypothetical protein
MSPSNITRWIGIGLLGLPLYGALTFWSSLNPQPDPGTRYEEWARFVTTDHYVLSHVFGSGLGLIFAIFGTFALAAYLTRSRAAGLGLVAMVLCVLGTALFLFVGGVSAFAAPEEGQAYLAGIEGLSELPPSFAANVFGLTFLAVIVLSQIGNVLLGAAIWRSEILPKWSGALWALAHVFMYVLGLVYAVGVGSQSTPPTVPMGAMMLVAAGLWMAWSVLRQTSARMAERAAA